MPLRTPCWCGAKICSVSRSLAFPRGQLPVNTSGGGLSFVHPACLPSLRLAYNCVGRATRGRSGRSPTPMVATFSHQAMNGVGSGHDGVTGRSQTARTLDDKIGHPAPHTTSPGTARCRSMGQPARTGQCQRRAAPCRPTCFCVFLVRRCVAKSGMRTVHPSAFANLISVRIRPPRSDRSQL